MNALADIHGDFPSRTQCRIPDALYFASNLEASDGSLGATVGQGTCVWVNYDNGGRMTGQIIRTGCHSCPGENYDQAMSAVCNDTVDTDALNLRYEYTWNPLNKLVMAKRFENGIEKLTMNYLYDSGGARVVREQVSSEDIFETYQDLYIGGYERRKVQLWNSALQPTPLGGAVQGDTYMDVEGTRLVKYAAGLRIEKEVESASPGVAWSAEKKFLSFSNHLGSTSAVIDYDTGALVEWNTHHAYGADESRWKNSDDKYANAEEPYGFTGKEEDKAVGLHYFGARYYSAYLGRWLSPDPPVVHGGGLTNYFGYGGNSPYIYVDPDGKWIHIIIGAVVGAVGGFVSGMVSGQGWKKSLAMAAVGAAVGAVVAATCGVAAAGLTAAMGGGVGATIAGGAIAGAAIGASAAFTQTFANSLISGSSAKQALSAAGGAAGWGALTGAIGGAGGAAFGLTNMGQAAQIWASAGAGSVLSAQVTITQVAIDTDGDLSKANWDEIISNFAINQTISAASSLGSNATTQMGDGATKGGKQVATDRAGASGGGGDFIESLPRMSNAELNAFVDSQPSRASNNVVVYGQGGNMGQAFKNAAGFRVPLTRRELKSLDFRGMDFIFGWVRRG